MLNYIRRIKFLCSLLLVLLLAFSVCRALFYLFNQQAFSGSGAASVLPTFYYGLRFDLSAICFINAIFMLLIIFPYNLMALKAFRLAAKIIFLVSNAIAILANCSDLVYFKFIAKRTTYDVFSLMFGGQSDFITLLPAFLKDYWYVFLLSILLLAGIWNLYNRLEKKMLVFDQEQSSVRDFIYRSIACMLLAGFSVLGMRGGTQLIPLGLVNAGDQVGNNLIPLVLNTPFSIMKSAELNTLNEVHYFSDAEVEQLLKPIKNKIIPTDTLPFQHKNVVLIILEGISKGYTGLDHRKSYTPFLDSLMKESLLFPNAFSNSKRSIEGVPAVLAGMPSFAEPYLNTIYSSNKIQSLASILKTKGYHSSFFHGGTNGTMSFDSFCAMAGFDRYFGRYEYNNEADYDGHWGIWDEPFLQYYAAKLYEMPEPFLSAVFTLSSHHPFQLPEKYKDKFPEGDIPSHKCVAYTDYALKLFFEKIKQAPWYRHTLFVVTSDHTGLADNNPFYNNAIGNFQIPLFFFTPDASLKGTDSSIVQQIDVMPTVLDYLHYNQPYFAFGSSALRKNKEGFAINMSNNEYQFYSDSCLFFFNGRQTGSVYRYKQDSLLQKNLLGQIPANYKAPQEKKLKAFIQLYNNSLIRNRTSFP